MKLGTLDFETFYDGEYSLSKMTNEEYVNDPRFETIGFAYKQEDGPTSWFSGSNDQIKSALSDIDWSQVGLIAHNTRFDGSILAWRYGFRPQMYYDTLSMAKPFHSANVGLSLAKLVEHYEIGEKGHEVLNAKGKRRADFTEGEFAAYGRYCCNDVDLTWKLFSCLCDRFGVALRKETELIDLTLRMYLNPQLMLDPSMLQREIELDQKKKAELLSKLTSLDLGPKSLSSGPQFAAVLQSLSVNPPTKLNSKGKKIWAFAKGDADFVALLNHDDPIVVAAVEARLGAKSTQRQSRAQRFLGIHRRMHGRLPVPLGYYNAHTGRYGGEEAVNLQNLQRAKKNVADSGLLRKSIIAPPGHSIVVADFSQIEARMLAWICQQLDKIEAFANRRDVYSEQASVIYGRKVDRKNNPDDFTPGFIGKAVVLGCGYGLGYLKFAGMIFVGMLGEKGILFDASYVDALGVDVPRWRLKKERREDEWQRIVSACPLLLDEETWVTHCAVAERIITVFRASNPRITEFWDVCKGVLEAMLEGETVFFGGPTGRLLRTEGTNIVLPNGMLLRYEGLEKDKEGNFSFLRRKEGRVQRVRTYGGSVTENITQALSRIPTTDLMLKADRIGIGVALQAHDEVGGVVPDEAAQDALDWMIRKMRVVPKWATGLPLDAEGGISKRYGDAK